MVTADKINRIVWRKAIRLKLHVKYFGDKVKKTFISGRWKKILLNDLQTSIWQILDQTAKISHS